MALPPFLTAFFTQDVSLRLLQSGIGLVSLILIFLLLFTLRDILLRSRSFVLQFVCVLLVGALPIVGFLVYLLIRPARTVKERDLERMLRTLVPEESDDPPESEDDGAPSDDATS